jgi:hypothetical protein
MVPPISLEVRYWCLIQKHKSFNLVAAILATDWPVSLLTALQIFAMTSSSSSDRGLASLSICMLYRAVAALGLKPNSWIYQRRKLSWVSEFCTICRDLVGAMCIKAQNNMAVASLINCQMQCQAVVRGCCFFATCHEESNWSDELRKLGYRPGGYA